MPSVKILAFASALLIPGTIQAQVLYGAIGGGATNSDLYIVDPATAEATAIGPIGFSVTGLSTDPLSGELYGTTAGGEGAIRQLIRISTTTGAGTVIGLLGAPIPDISFSSGGTLYGWSEFGDDLVTINTATGAITIVGESGLDTSGSGLDFSPSGVLYFAGNTAAGFLRIINPVTGAPTNGPVMNGGIVQVRALAFHPTTGVLYAVVNYDLATINATTGEVTIVGSLPTGFDAIAWGEAAAVPSMPLPTLLVLAVLMAGLATLLLRRRTRMV